MDRSRFRAWATLDPSEVDALIVGCGGLNSYVVPCLVRLGLQTFTLVDPDTVEAANVATQDFQEDDVGSDKVDALCQRIQDINSTAAVYPYRDRWRGTETKELDENGEPTRERQTGNVAWDVVIVGTDNIESRREVFAAWCRGDLGEDAVYIDHRMSFTSYDLTVLGPWDKGVGGDEGSPEFVAYATCLDDPVETFSEERCGAKAIAFTGMHAGARVGAIVARIFLRGERLSGMLAEVLVEKVTAQWWVKSHEGATEVVA